jgi:predicted alpha/beta-hydrolase family hydrolase
MGTVMDRVSIPVADGSVSGLLLRPGRAKALFLFAHGAGAGMNHRSMALIAEGLAIRQVATLRYQFPSMEKGVRRPDPPTLAHEAVRSAAAHARLLAPDLPLYAGGRSFGGRMTSQAQAQAPITGVQGLVFLGFPLHPAGKPSVNRAEHLSGIRIPMLFISGTRDALAELNLLKSMVAGLGDHATLHLVNHADHSFNVLIRSGRTTADAGAEVVDTLVSWMAPCTHDIL